MERRSIYKRLLSAFFQGLLVVAPITLILYIVYRLFTFLDDLIPTDTPGLGILILIIGITILGFLFTTFVTQRIVNRANKLLDRIPLVKTIYTAITDLLSAFVGQKKSFSQPVLVTMNKENGIEKLGFMTNDDLSSLNIEGQKIAVYLPHSFNFSGNLYIVPAQNVTPIDANTGEVMKFIVSGGVTEIGKKHED